MDLLNHPFFLQLCSGKQIRRAESVGERDSVVERVMIGRMISMMQDHAR